MRLSEHFTSEEFDCHHCHSGGENMDGNLIDALENLREYIGAPVIIMSGYRCPEHPESKRRPGSYHPQGKAADIRVKDWTVPRLYLAAAGTPAFHKAGGIGIYDKGFIHVDVRPHKTRWGQLNGVYVPFLTAWEWMRDHSEVTA